MIKICEFKVKALNPFVHNYYWLYDDFNVRRYLQFIWHMPQEGRIKLMEN